jgi:hypothetical protein
VSLGDIVFIVGAIVALGVAVILWRQQRREDDDSSPTERPDDD